MLRLLALDREAAARFNIRTIVRIPNYTTRIPRAFEGAKQETSEPPVDEDNKAAKSVVQSLAKGFQVLTAFTSDEPELVLADVSRRASLDKGTTFRLLNTLVMLGYIERVEDTRRFRLSLKCLDLGFNAIARSELRTQARPILRG